PARTRLRASAPHARAILRAILSLPSLCAYAPSTPMPSRCRTPAFALHPRAFLRARFQSILSRACRRVPVFPRTLPACTPNARASPPDPRLSPIRPSATPVQPSCSPGSITTSASFPPPLSTSLSSRIEAISKLFISASRLFPFASSCAYLCERVSSSRVYPLLCTRHPSTASCSRGLVPLLMCLSSSHTSSYPPLGPCVRRFGPIFSLLGSSRLLVFRVARARNPLPHHASS
ncbi:Unknown protein, partial [Striga hermonthica]